MNVAALNLRTRTYLGTAEDDPQFTDGILTPIANEAYQSLIRDLQEVNSSYLATFVTLSPVSATSRTYLFASQSPAITDFAGWLDVRHTDADGARFREVPYDQLNYGGEFQFAITGTDDAPTFLTSPDCEAGLSLYLLYIQQPTELTTTTQTPSKIATRFHDVIALEMASIAYGLGGEQSMPAELYARWQDRRGQLLQSVSRRGADVARMRLDLAKEF